jgi:hypothetical protein
VAQTRPKLDFWWIGSLILVAISLALCSALGTCFGSTNGHLGSGQSLEAGQKSSSLSPHDRFVIALHSPDRVVETGLLVCPPEKKAAKLASSNEQDTFSGPV